MEERDLRCEVCARSGSQRSIPAQPRAPNSTLVSLVARERSLPVSHPARVDRRVSEQETASQAAPSNAPVSQLRLPILARRDEQVVRVPRCRGQERREVNRGDGAGVAVDSARSGVSAAATHTKKPKTHPAQTSGVLCGRVRAVNASSPLGGGGRREQDESGAHLDSGTRLFLRHPGDTHTACLAREQQEVEAAPSSSCPST